jgi:5-methylcytosine-specific restriction endonuclease McrA
MAHVMHERIRFYAALSDSALLSAVESNSRIDREGTIELVASLAELEARRLYSGLGYSSLYIYCTEHLRLSEHEARTRMEAARAALKCPMVLDMLVAGDLTMTTAAILKPWLTEENCLTLLEAARRKSKREVQAIVAKLGPSVDCDSEIYPVPGGYRFEVTIDDDAYRTFRRLQELLRHAIPSGDPAQIVVTCFNTTLREIERRKLANVHRPRPQRLQNLRTRHIPADVRRQVWKRDGAQCAFVGTQGRCQERGFLEIHHLVPFARGGEATVDNLQLRCRAHNQYEADQAGLARPLENEPREPPAASVPAKKRSR